MAHVPNTTKGRQTRAKLLEASRVVFGRDGYVGATMSAVATEAGMSLGGLYRYFDDKDDVFSALVADTHDDLFNASGATEHRLEDDAWATLRDSNLGYLVHYRDNRDIMRALVESASVEPRFRDFWWTMRNRHIQRFTATLTKRLGVESVGGLPLTATVEALACMTEQSAYVWYAQDALREEEMDVEEAANIVTRVWHATIFGPVPATPIA